MTKHLKPKTYNLQLKSQGAPCSSPSQEGAPKPIAPRLLPLRHSFFPGGLFPLPNRPSSAKENQDAETLAAEIRLQTLGKFEKGQKTSIRFKRGNEEVEAPLEF